jgi:hypothetical protein
MKGSGLTCSWRPASGLLTMSLSPVYPTSRMAYSSWVGAGPSDVVQVTHRVGGANVRRGPLPLRWVYFHVLREFAQHCGHANILCEQILSE